MNVNDPMFQKILAVINRLDRDGLLIRLAGNCVLAADLIQNMLHAEGISSRTVEVQLLGSREDTQDGVKTVALVGYNVGTTNTHHLDTHVVVVTEGEEPLLIDAAIGHILGNHKHVIITPLAEVTNSDIIAQTLVDQTELTYRAKKRIQLPHFHQKNLVEKMKQEHNLLQNVRWIKIGLGVALTMSTVNFFLNSILVVLKLIYQ
jgi:hypothetical protein